MVVRELAFLDGDLRLVGMEPVQFAPEGGFLGGEVGSCRSEHGVLGAELGLVGTALGQLAPERGLLGGDLGLVRSGCVID